MRAADFRRRLLGLARGARRDEKGAIAVTFALALLPMMGLVGAAVDYSQLSNARGGLQSAADAAVLTATRMPDNATHAERTAAAQAVFGANIHQLRGVQGAAGTLTRVAANHYRFTVDTQMATSVMRVLGVDSARLGVTAEAQRASVAVRRPTEFVIAFDITNSMVFTASEFELAVDAMQDFVTQMFGTGRQESIIGSVMPFSDRVRLPERNNAWFTGSRPAHWAGCLQVREQVVAGRPQTLTDDPPATTPFAYFSPYVANTAGHSYEFNCFGAEATIAETRPERLNEALDNMGRGGTGRPDEGMAWAWRILSPRWSNQWNRGNYPAPYGGTVRKLAILVTDGRTEAYRHEVLPPSGVPAVYGHNMGSARGFENLEDVCQRMRTAGIEIAVVQLNGNERATPHLQRCASPSMHFLINSLNDFRSAFRVIEGGASSQTVRLVR